MTIGERINALCDKNDIKQKELAELIGVTEATMSRYINDKRVPKGESAAKMATILGVTTEYLLGISDDPQHLTNNQSNNFLEVRFDEENLKLNKEDIEELLNKLKNIGFDVKKLL